MENRSSDIEQVPPVSTSSMKAGSLVDDATHASTPQLAPSFNTEATVNNSTNANERPSSQKRNSLLAVPTRTSSKNGPSSTSTVNAGGVADGGSNPRKRRKRRDGEAGSVKSGHSTGEGRTHKSNSGGGGISKFFSVFLNCCRAPDSAHNVEDVASRVVKKPENDLGRHSLTAEVPIPKPAQRDSTIDTGSKVETGKKEDHFDMESGAKTSVGPFVETGGDAEGSEKPAVTAPNVLTQKQPIPQLPTRDKLPALPSTEGRLESPLATTGEIDAIRPSTSSPAPAQRTIPRATDDALIRDVEPDPVYAKAAAVKTDLPPLPTEDEESQKNVAKPHVEDAPVVDQAHEGIVAEESQAAPEQKQWLLPPVKPEHQGRKCLVLDLDETLVHSSFKLIHQADFTIPVEIEGAYHNVYVIKRPGVDQFMKRVGELYEVVVFTASVSKYGDPLLDQLDIHHVVHHRLFRESCFNHQGNYVKDLSQLGRDLKDTIIIDNSPTSYIFHPQHAVPISSWFSDAHDNELLDLIPVLEDLSGNGVKDVSMVLDVSM